MEIQMASKNNDPYLGVIDLMHNIGGTAGRQAMPGIGTVVSPPPNLVVAYNGMELNKAFLWVDEYWLQGHYRESKGHIISETQPRAGGTGAAEYQSHTHDIHNDYTKTRIMTDTWHVGDKVMLIPIVGDDNSTAEQYFVYGKCRRLDGNG